MLCDGRAFWQGDFPLGDTQAFGPDDPYFWSSGLDGGGQCVRQTPPGATGHVN